MRHLRHLPSRQREEAAGPLRREAAALAGLGAATLVAAVTGVSLCPFATLTGVPCPGCGLCRATLALLRGSVHDALRAHPLIVVILPALAALAIYVARGSLARTPARDRLVAIAAGTLVALLFAVWIARFGGAFGGPVAVDSVWNRQPAWSAQSLARRLR